MLAAARAIRAEPESAALKHAYLCEQIEMRVLGIGFAEHAVSWSTGGAHARTRSCSKHLAYTWQSHRSRDAAVR
eukprot:2371784-Pleurochrysis_carterae.AAC.1